MADHDHRAPDDVTESAPTEPGIDEDDIFAAILGLPGTGAFWGSVPSSASAQQEPEWSEEADRQRRREEILRKWVPQTGE
jgi:hypothetical protein